MEPQKGTELYNRFFVRKEEKYNRNLLLKFTDKWRFITFKFRVYIYYKTLIETLFLSLEQFGIGKQIFSFWRKTNISKRKKLEEYRNEAKKQFDLKNFQKAVKYLNKIESLGDSWIFADRAFANFKLGKKQEAIKDINTALKLEKDNKNYHNLRDEIIKYK
jgi:tetratricopeptide (TPR) repeat protein